MKCYAPKHSYEKSGSGHPEFISGSSILLYYLFEEVIPIWIYRLYEVDLPFPMPVLELFFSLYGRFYITTVFIIYEFLAIIFCRETIRIDDLSMF